MREKRQLIQGTFYDTCNGAQGMVINGIQFPASHCVGVWPFHTWDEALDFFHRWIVDKAGWPEDWPAWEDLDQEQQWQVSQDFRGMYVKWDYIYI